AVVRGLRKGKGGVEPRKRRPITWERVAPIEPYVPRAVWAMVQLHWHTGMRSGELVMLRSCDIDMSGDIWIYRPQQHKTEHLDHIRAIAIGPKAQDILRPWLRADLDAYLFQARESEQLRNTTRRDNRQTPKWPSHDPDHRRRKRGRKGKANRRPGEHYTTSSYYRAVKRAILAASIDAWCVDHGDDSHWSGAYRQWLRAKPKRLRREIDAWKREHGSEAMHSEAFRGFLASRDWHPHQLRHTFATRARSEFEEWDPVRAALGHTSPQTTIVYARLDERKAAKVAKKIG
ncbi:MAG: site-specific integrase, partial [Pirellulales bacterium]|nr:site-specific integrase [Pirellulales bacterium]